MLPFKVHVLGASNCKVRALGASNCMKLPTKGRRNTQPQGIFSIGSFTFVNFTDLSHW